jgi:flagellar FliJ protein
MPKKFNFPLQRVLVVRQHEEEQKAIELSKARSILDRENEKLMNLANNKEEFFDQGSRRRQRTDVHHLRLETDYLNQLNNAIFNQTRTVQKNEKAVQKRTDELRAAIQKKRIVEILKEHKLEDYKTELSREQLKRDNEIAIRMEHSKKNKGEV